MIFCPVLAAGLGVGVGGALVLARGFGAAGFGAAGFGAAGLDAVGALRAVVSRLAVVGFATGLAAGGAVTLTARGADRTTA